MADQKILDYVDTVISNIKAPESIKKQLENDLIRYIMNASESIGLEEVKKNLNTPEKLAEELTKKLPEVISEEHKPQPHRKSRPQRYTGEFMLENSDVNLKLLYIPLLQISSGTRRIVMPLTEDDEDD